MTLRAGVSLHRIPLPRGAAVAVASGDAVAPDQVLARWRTPGEAVAVPVSRPLRRPPGEVDGLLTVRPGTQVARGEPLARSPVGRTVPSPLTGMLVGTSRTDGAALVAPLGDEETIVGHVSGRVGAIDAAGITIEVPAAVVHAVGGSGEAVHGELVIGVHEPGEELRAGAIDVGKGGKIIVGGSRASAETLTRARAMGVAGVVLGGILDKELRDFERIQERRRKLGGMRGAFALVLLEGFGKVALDPELFGWFRAQAGKTASVFGEGRTVFVYDAPPPPARRPLAGVGERVVAHRRPFQGRSGVLVAVLDDLHAAPSGIATRMALVRFEDGRLAAVPLANLEAVLPGAPVG